MKILFITPYDNNYRYKSAFVKSLSYMPLTMPYLAALTPNEYDITFKVIDEGIEKCNYNKLDFYDIVAITSVTSSAKRGYELAQMFKEKGSYIVMGGHHVTLMKEEAIKYANTILLGPSDQIWPKFIYDYMKKEPKKMYIGNTSDINKEKIIPLRDIMNRKKYINVPTVIANFGCANHCEFCVINSFWGANNTARNISCVVEEIKKLKTKRVLFLDPSPTSNEKYAKELFKALIPLKIKWAGLCTTDILENEDLFDLMIKSGCIGILMGFETFNEQSLKESNKKNKVKTYKEVVKKFHENGVTILGTFMIGFDNDTKESILNMPKYIEEIGVDIPRFAIMTPYPNTPIYKKLEKENRIITTNWNYYDSIHAVYKPKNCSKQELEQMLLKISNETYSFKNIIKRLIKNRNGGIFNILVNIGFKIYNKRIEKTLKI